VERVAADEVLGAIDRPALALVLEAPVRLELRAAGKVEIEVRRPPRRARGTGEHEPQYVGVLVVLCKRTKAEEVSSRLRREPLGDIRRRRSGDALTCDK